MKKVNIAFLILTLAIYLWIPARAREWNIKPREQAFTETAETVWPGWRITYISSYHTGTQLYYTMTLMHVADGMLQVRQIIAADEDEIGMDWQVWDLAPIPLTERGTSEAAKALTAFILSPTRYKNADDFLTENDLLSQSALFLLNENEKLSELHPYNGYLAGIAENEAGQRSLRIANWNGMEYSPALATPMQEPFYINDYHSTTGFLEIYAASGEDWLELGEDGVWRLSTHTPDEGTRYFFTEEGIVDSGTAEFYSWHNNDGWHYGIPCFSTALPNLVFTAVPDLEDAVFQLDADGWACVKTEGAALYDKPDGNTLAFCFCRLPGRVQEQQDNWTQLMIGSEKLGKKAWFRTQDLAFGAETEDVICTFPAYSLTDQAETAFEQMIQEILQTEFYVTERWLIGRQTDGDWLMLINQEEVCTLPAEYISETWPTEHEWEENVWDDWEEEP